MSGKIKTVDREQTPDIFNQIGINWDFQGKATPYFYFDKELLRRSIAHYSQRKFKLYYSAKSCLFKGLVKEVSDSLEGFTVSSIDYLQSVREETSGPIHFISPLLREREIKKINSLGYSLTFNSFEQFERLKSRVGSHIKKFIRINPEISSVKEDRLNPAKPFSQLGVPLSQCERPFKADGLHFHNNHQSRDPRDIIKVLTCLENYFKSRLCSFQFINLGGGYLWSENLMAVLNKEQNQWKRKYGITFIIEPGFDISNGAGFLISSVVDIFKRGGKNIAILNTSVNHLPNVFSYQKSPEAVGHSAVHPHSYILAGASCLAGDVFGEFRFERKMELGDRVIFKNVGSYTLVKASSFNGIKIPKVYMS